MIEGRTARVGLHAGQLILHTAFSSLPHRSCGISQPKSVRPTRDRQSRQQWVVSSAANAKQPSKSAKATVYPAGRKQATFRTPACVIKVDSSEVLEQLPHFEETLAEALAGGVTSVLLSDSPESTGASLYEAASILKGFLRGRATLLVADRIDIVDAAEADGVLLTPKGAHRCTNDPV